MATVLDFSILSSLSIIFIFILVFVGSWGLLMMLNPFSFKDTSTKKVYSIFAFALAFIVILSRPIVSIVAFSLPWFAFMTIVAFFLLFFLKMINPSMSTGGLHKDTTILGFTITFAAIIILFGMANTFGQDLLEEQPGVPDADALVGGTQAVDTFEPVDQADVVVADGPTVRDPTTNDIGSNIVLTLFHPNILGMLFMLVLATMTILLIAR